MSALLVAARRADRPDLEPARVELLDQALDRAALAGGVGALEGQDRAQAQAVMMNQIYNQEPASLSGLRSGVDEAVSQVVLRALAKNPADRYPDWDSFAQALSQLVSDRKVPRGQIQGVLDSERFTLLRSLDFFSSFGDVELWEVVHRAKWQRFPFGHSLYKRGDEGRGMALALYRQMTGQWPRGRFEDTAPCPPSREVLNKIRSLNIAYARRRQLAEATEGQAVPA